MLPEGAEFSASSDAVSVSVKRTGHDSLRISAQGFRQPKQKILVAGDIGTRLELTTNDTLGTKVQVERKQHYPRGKPEQEKEPKGIIISVVLLILVALLIYEYKQRQNE